MSSTVHVWKDYVFQYASSLTYLSIQDKPYVTIEFHNERKKLRRTKGKIETFEILNSKVGYWIKITLSEKYWICISPDLIALMKVTVSKDGLTKTTSEFTIQSITFRRSPL